MGECLIVRRGGESYELPVLDASYPKDVTVTAAANGSASFSVSITTPGRPAEYTYQWYKNGEAVSGATGNSLTLTGLTAAATYSIYCKVVNKAGSVNSRTAVLTVQSYLPAYTYSGSAQLIDDGNFNWRLKLFTSGNLTFSHLGSAGSGMVDAFLVGGGGAGVGADGGGGGYTQTVSFNIQKGTPYSIVIGAGGMPYPSFTPAGTTNAFNASAAGGFNGGGGGGKGGSGGASLGGVGGSNGGDGGGSSGGQGQGSTTREFGEMSGELYSGGGGGGSTGTTAGGEGGGGRGGWGTSPDKRPFSGTVNTGGGGGGNYDGTGGAGGSGIVIIRNRR